MLAITPNNLAYVYWFIIITLASMSMFLIIKDVFFKLKGGLVMEVWGEEEQYWKDLSYDYSKWYDTLPFDELAIREVTLYFEIQKRQQYKATPEDWFNTWEYIQNLSKKGN